MKVALVNPFDPLPGEPVREGRYAAFARALALAGHEVLWYSSDFSHTLKRPRDPAAIAAACAEAGFAAELTPTLPYARNVSRRRLQSHRALAGAVSERLRTGAFAPDVVLVSSPPPSLAAAVAETARSRGARLALDVQDLWPEALATVLPAGLRWLARLAGRAMTRDMRRAESAADLGVGVAEAYRRYFHAHARPGTPSHTLHLGADLARFDGLVEAGDANPPPALASAAGGGERWILVGGMVGAALDWAFLLRLAERLWPLCPDARILVAGTGPAEEGLARQLAARRLGNVRLLGYQPYPAFCALAARADVGLCHFRQDSRVSFPNRVFDYFAAGLDVINTIPGELADLLAEREAGFTTTSFDAGAAADYVRRALARRPAPDDRPAPRLRRGEWVAAFDRPTIARRLVTLLEGLAASR